jgi:5-formyltetrahydrofolate cyclo-ligase
MRSRRGGIGAEEARAAGREVARILLELSEFAPPAQVALYATLPAELPIEPLFGALREQGRTPLFPRCIGDRLEFAPAERFDDLAPGRYGVAEPVAPAVTLWARDVVVVPGLAFDGQGRRLGQGAGYYDRTFPPGSEAPRLVGVGFDCQRVEVVPAGRADRRMDAVVTERGVIRVERGESGVE